MDCTGKLYAASRPPEGASAASESHDACEIRSRLIRGQGVNDATGAGEMVYRPLRIP